MRHNYLLKFYWNTKFTIKQTSLYYFSENRKLSLNIHIIRFPGLLSTQSSLLDVKLTFMDEWPPFTSGNGIYVIRTLLSLGSHLWLGDHSLIPPDNERGKKYVCKDYIWTM